MDTNSTLHQSLLESLVPTTDRCMHVLFARCWVLHCHLFVNRHMQENSAVGEDRLLHRGINPTVHVVTWIPRAVARGMNRLIVAALSTDTFFTKRRAGCFPACTAFASADSTTFANGPDARLSTNLRVARASVTCLPRITSAIKRTLRGDWR